MLLCHVRWHSACHDLGDGRTLDSEDRGGSPLSTDPVTRTRPEVAGRPSPAAECQSPAQALSESGRLRVGCHWQWPESRADRCSVTVLLVLALLPGGMLSSLSAT